MRQPVKPALLYSKTRHQIPRDRTVHFPRLGKRVAHEHPRIERTLGMLRDQLDRPSDTSIADRTRAKPIFGSTRPKAIAVRNAHSSR